MHGTDKEALIKDEEDRAYLDGLDEVGAYSHTSVTIGLPADGVPWSDGT